MSKFKKYYLILFLILNLFVQPVWAGPTDEAQSKLQGSFGKVFGSGSGSPKNIGEIVGEIINYVLSFLGVIFVVLTIYAGFTWMTAGGDSDKITTAKDTLVSAVIGLAIVLSSYTITYLVLTNLITASTDEFIY